MRTFVSAVIVAAGNSTRMGTGKSKQFIMLRGEPVIKHTLCAFEISDLIDSVVVVCREQDENETKSIIKKSGFGKVKAVVYGGKTRGESVKNGVQACDERTTHFAIHDGARPLVVDEDIKAVVSEAVKCKAAALGTLVTDTVKVVDENNVIVSTPDRQTLRAVQTPQVFEKDLYLRALSKGNNEGVTDDCQLVESIGEKVKIVIGSGKNIKLTTLNDILLAEALLGE